jgi:uncharacterized membrane protein
MATLSAWKFDTPDGAQRAEQILLDMQKQQLVSVIDAAIVTWPADKKKPKTRQLHHMGGAGALEGAFWGMLFGLIFFVPFLGMAIGAGLGALTAGAMDIGIDDNFIKGVRDKVTPGTSALFLLTTGMVQDRVLPELASLHPELITTNLSTEQEEQLRTAFAQE